MNMHCTLCLLVSLLASFHLASCEEYYIVPTPSSACLSEPCLTLSQFADNITNYIISNTSLIITEGEHVLNVELPISNAKQFQLLRIDNDSDTSQTNIVCNEQARFLFSRVSRVSMDGITFIGCDGTQFNSVKEITIENSIFVGQDNTVTMLTITSSSVTIVGTQFLSNTAGTAGSFSSSMGGALIVTNSTVSVDRCLFEGNKAQIGGAIFCELESNITITNSDFLSNHATDCDGNEQCLGGALYIDGTSTLMLYNGTFQNNTSDQFGGSVAIESRDQQNNAYNSSFNGGLPLRIIKATMFNNNGAVLDGGAVYLNGGNITMSDCVFLHNGALQRHGGAITSLATTSLSLSNTRFFFNFAAGDGGALYVHNSTILADNNTFMSNHACGSGGVMYAVDYSTVRFTEQCLFFNNSAEGDGGVLYATENTTVLVNNCEGRSNTADRGGVFVVTGKSTGSIYNSTFEDNVASRWGGVLYIFSTGSSAVIHSSNFSYNMADSYGGVASMRFGGELLVYDSLFEHNIAGLEAGVLNGFIDVNIKVYRSIFNNNTADQGGVSVVFFNSSFVGEDSVFNNNVNVDLGAVIRAINGNDVSFRNCNFTNNSANYGGALTSTSNNTFNIINCRFYGNKANNDGGVLYARILGRVTIENCVFFHNRAINDGITYAADDSFMTLSNNTFMENVAGHDGGVTYAYVNTTINIYNCTFLNNRAENSGGAVYGRNRCKITIIESMIGNHMAQSSGGAVFAQDRSNISVEASNIANNTADYGGGLRVYVSSIAYVSNSNFTGNAARVSGGAMSIYEKSTAMVTNGCRFVLNTANFGGVFIAYQNIDNILIDTGSTTVTVGVDGESQRNAVEMNDSTFYQNRANSSAGVMYLQGSRVSVDACTFDDNRARYDGGIISGTISSVINITNSNFANSNADENGGAFDLVGDTRANIENCSFIHSRALVDGGVIHLRQSTAFIINSTIDSSLAKRNGGCIFLMNSTVEVDASTFRNNSAAERGGVIYSSTNSILTVQQGSFVNNRAVNFSGGVLYLTESSNGNFSETNFGQNRAKTRGGAVYVTESSTVHVSFSNFNKNMANQGPALAARRMSSIYFGTSPTRNVDDGIISNDAPVQIHENVAEDGGGGIYLSDSSLYLLTETYVTQNNGGVSGGGILAVNSSITIGDTVHFVSNQAEMEGGGISLVESKIFDDNLNNLTYDINFISNQANLGGGIFVDDEKEMAICSNNPNTGVYFPSSECFFQSVTDSWMFNFGNNQAKTSGADLYGGLLDRCLVVSGTNSSGLWMSGASKFKEMSNITNFETVNSKPVRICICNDFDNKPDCDRQPHSIKVKNKDSFSILVAAINQVNQTISATVQSRFDDLYLSESQRIRRIDASCSSLEYRVSFPNVSRSYDLTLFPEGPCDDKGNSGLNVDIEVVDCSCPPGFIPADTDLECSCVCDDRYGAFSKLIDECNFTTESIIRRGQFWITYFHDSRDTDSGPYFIYPYCPFDYCLPSGEAISIDLNQLSGSDAQCANNRSGMLCGSCQTNYSLSLGSSKCLICHDKWHGLLEGIVIAAFFAGIILVVLLLVLNLTVAVGTLNSIIFYANIIYVGRSEYFSQRHFTVFISWINLDIGIDTCFFEGMDSYAKTWLELAFPLFIIFLVVVIIWVSSCSSRFTNLIGKRNPVATLATLILLSYTKLLQVVIASFSFVILKFPNGTSSTRWLPDASVKYSEGKLIALVCVAILILILGLLYTIIIFSWQWLLRLSHIKLFAWTKNQKLHTFINTYNHPYNAKHRYWTGLLLLVRVVVYLIYAFSTSLDPKITLLFTAIIMCTLITYKTVRNVKVYKNRLLNATESFVLFNMAIFSVITLYTFNDLDNTHEQRFQVVTAFFSVGMIVILCLLVILYHVYRYGNSKVYDLIYNSNFCQRLTEAVVKSRKSDLEKSTPLARENKLFDVLDRQESRLGYIPPSGKPFNGPTTSDITLSHCERSPDESESNSSFLNHLDVDRDRSGSLGTPRREADNNTPKERPMSESPIVRSTSGIKFEFRRQTDSSISLKSYTSTVTTNETITEPLLAEEKV